MLCGGPAAGSMSLYVSKSFRFMFTKKFRNIVQQLITITPIYYVQVYSIYHTLCVYANRYVNLEYLIIAGDSKIVYTKWRNIKRKKRVGQSFRSERNSLEKLSSAHTL